MSPGPGGVGGGVVELDPRAAVQHFSSQVSREGRVGRVREGGRLERKYLLALPPHAVHLYRHLCNCYYFFSCGLTLGFIRGSMPTNQLYYISAPFTQECHCFLEPKWR